MYQQSVNAPRDDVTSAHETHFDLKMEETERKQSTNMEGSELQNTHMNSEQET